MNKKPESLDTVKKERERERERIIYSVMEYRFFV